MIKQLFISSIAVSLLFSLSVSADHHHHDKIEHRIEKALEHVKERERRKSIGDKAIHGTLQTVNKVPWLAAVAPTLIVAKCTEPNNYSEKALLVWSGKCLGAYIVSWILLKTISGAMLSQEGVKPLGK